MTGDRPLGVKTSGCKQQATLLSVTRGSAPGERVRDTGGSAQNTCLVASKDQ